MEGVRNYRQNYAQLQLQIILISPVCYTPKLGFSDILWYWFKIPQNLNRCYHP